MDRVTRYRAMAAFCQQRAKMAGENEHFWLIEADSWSTLLASETVDTLLKEIVARGAGGRRAYEK